MEKTRLIQLAKTLNLTRLDIGSEPYILTKKEEDAVIDHAIAEAKKHMAWRLADKSAGIALSEGEILTKIALVDWSERIDREEILFRANENKQYSLWQEEQRQIERVVKAEKQKELKEVWTAKRMFSMMSYVSQNEFGKKLIVNDDNKSLITALCFFFSGDDRFETELGYSFGKGLCIRGISGLGKTHLIRCISENELRPVDIVSMIGITDAIKNSGEYEPPISANRVLYLDDVGTEEPVVNFFGTKISFLKDFIEWYYLKNKQYNRLVISTNNSFQEVEDKYGFRVRSRFKDMFNFIDVKGKDMRG